MSKLEIYEQLKERVLGCEQCDLYCDGKVEDLNPRVMGDGNLDADLMFVAENPGINEIKDRISLTPSGMSGKKYASILKALGLKRKDVYTTNIVLCHTPKNRDPEPWEVKRCRPHFEEQVKLVKPRLIITFGRFAANNFIKNFKITRDHGQVFYNEHYNTDIYPIFHPSFAFVYASQKQRAEFKDDIKRLKGMLADYRDEVAA